jgi:hypothetical protein
MLFKLLLLMYHVFGLEGPRQRVDTSSLTRLL